MAINTKEVKKRINTVKNTKKITKAMEMIAAVKMRKAVEQAVHTREYAILANEVLENLGKTTITHKLSKNYNVNKVLIILVTSNRGLCGSYNSKVLKEAEKVISKIEEEVDVIAIGKKAAQFTKKKNLNLVSFYEKLNENPKYEDVLPLTGDVLRKFKNKEYKKVIAVYTNYISGLVQEVNSKTLLPINKESIAELIKEAGTDKKNEEVELEENLNDFEYEPIKNKVLDFVLPMLVETQIYQAILESAASEHSSRMIAMKNASESASEMIDDLTLEFNKGRQAAITQEVSEIVAGASS